MQEHYADINARTIDGWVAAGWEWGTPISHEIYLQALAGEWGVLLTPQIPVPKDWFAPYLVNGRLSGCALLGLASGGGQQMPVFAALGADVSVLDYSTKQLESERMVAAREGYAIACVQADMTKPLPFADETFDVIFHPVSNSYVEDVQHIWRECHRVLRPGGVLLAGMSNGVDYLFEDSEREPLLVKNVLPYNPLKDPVQLKQNLAQDDGVQFSHSLEEQIDGQLQAGFRLTNLYEDREPDGDAVAKYCPQYFATRAVKE